MKKDTNTRPIDTHCPFCGTQYEKKPKTTFLGFTKIKCIPCNKNVVYPLTTNYSKSYQGFLITVAVLAKKEDIMLRAAGAAFLGFILFKNYQLKKLHNSLENKTPKLTDMV